MMTHESCCIIIKDSDLYFTVHIIIVCMMFTEHVLKQNAYKNGVENLISGWRVIENEYFWKWEDIVAQTVVLCACEHVCVYRIVEILTTSLWQSWREIYRTDYCGFYKTCKLELKGYIEVIIQLVVLDDQVVGLIVKM